MRNSLKIWCNSRAELWWLLEILLPDLSDMQYAGVWKTITTTITTKNKRGNIRKRIFPRAFKNSWAESTQRCGRGYRVRGLVHYVDTWPDNSWGWACTCVCVCGHWHCNSWQAQLHHQSTNPPDSWASGARRGDGAPPLWVMHWPQARVQNFNASHLKFYRPWNALYLNYESMH